LTLCYPLNAPIFLPSVPFRKIFHSSTGGTCEQWLMKIIKRLQLIQNRCFFQWERRSPKCSSNTLFISVCYMYVSWIRNTNVIMRSRTSNALLNLFPYRKKRCPKLTCMGSVIRMPKHHHRPVTMDGVYQGLGELSPHMETGQWKNI